MTLSRSFVPVITLFAVTGTLGLACSSKDPETGLASAGGSGAVGSGATGGSSRGGSSSGTSGRGGSGGTGATGGTAASGGSGNGTSSGGSGNGTSSGGSGNGTSSGGSGAYPSDACSGLPFELGGQAGGDGACTGVESEAEPVAIDLFIMMDRSVSMNNLLPDKSKTRWEALREAMEAFVETNADQDVRAGIGFFGVTGGSDDAIDCNQSKYAVPTVEIGALADVGPDLVAAMAAMQPGGLTPGGPALAGALEHASDWAKDNVGRATAVVLVSDGFPTQCQPQSQSGLSAIAEEAHLNAPYVRTYAVGIGGFNLDAIALAGGTHHAFNLDEGDLAKSFADALGNVANTRLACEYALPPPPAGNQKLDLAKVQVTYTTAGGDSEEIPSIPGLSSCGDVDNGGWFYDNPADPTSIAVCPCTCARFDAGRVDVRVGCKPRIGVR
jgi:hypothetical protein